MKSSTVMVILALLAVLAMGTFAAAAQENAAAVGESKVGYFKKCCKNCRSFSGAVVCDDISDKCHPDCVNCRVVQEGPVKTFRCADGKTDDGTCGQC